MKQNYLSELFLHGEYDERAVIPKKKEANLLIFVLISLASLWISLRSYLFQLALLFDLIPIFFSFQIQFIHISMELDD